ncbi:MAG: dienelactone hydrolase family protein [Pyrinomonadaceae bacterium]
MKTETLSFSTAGGDTTAYAALPDEAGENPKAVILIQEWWGLADHIKDIARRYADEGFICIAPDLYRGKLASNPDEASKLMHALAIEDGLDTIKNAMDKARETYGLKHFGITGYCMGGTFALRAACELEGLSAAAPFYGDIPEEEVLKKLKTPVIFVSGTEDAWINPEKVAQLEEIADKYELPVDSVKYEADHAFFNDTRPEVYNEEAAKDAWALVTEFFDEKL